MNMHNRQCFSNHIGAWLMEPIWFQEAVNVIKSGKMPTSPQAQEELPSAYSGKAVRASRSDGSAGPVLYTVTNDGVAVIEMEGPMMKGYSKFGGTNTLAVRVALRAAAEDPDVTGIMLHIDSPGGHVAGTAEVADEVRNVKKAKPVFAHIDDLGASAAFWVASACDSISINQMGKTGSIGTVAVVEDSSKMYEAAGVTVHVISTGAFKGAFNPGAPVTAEHLAYLQEMIDGINQFFLAAVQKGRGMSATKLAAIADGRVFSAAKALELGLVDAVQPFDKALAEVKKAGGAMVQYKRAGTKQAAMRLAIEDAS